MNDLQTQPFYDPQKSYEDNFRKGPFGAFANGEAFQTSGRSMRMFIEERVGLPFGIAAGPLLNGKFVKAALDKGFDLVTYKTVRTTRYASHPWPNILFVKAEGNLKAQESVVADNTPQDLYHISVTNSFGVPSYNPDFWQADMRDAVLYAKEGQMVIGSFQGTSAGDGNVKMYVEDFKLGARLTKETGVKIMEVNLSCPNEGSGHLLCYDIKRVQIVVSAIKNIIGNTPLIVKIGYFADKDLFKRFLKSIGSVVEGIEAINTIQATIIKEDGQQALPGKGREKSGVCGSAIKWAGIEMTKRLKRYREKFNLKYTIIGVGGVIGKEDYDDYLHAGADAVMSATGAMWYPYMAIEIKRELGFTINKL